MAASRCHFERLARHHDRAAFSCGVEALDRYLHEQASQDQRRKLAVPYVLADTTGRVVGYYTLSSLSIRPASLPGATTRKLPHYEAFPAILLRRIAVDQQYRGQGFGRLLLVDALNRCLELSERLGTMAVVVDAKGDEARAFYEHYGFRRLVDHEYRLYLPIGTIAQIHSGKGQP